MSYEVWGDGDDFDYYTQDAVNEIIAEETAELRDIACKLAVALRACPPLLDLAAHTCRAKDDFDSAQVYSDVSGACRDVLKKWEEL